MEINQSNSMYRGYHVVANTAAGRRRYMQYLVPFVLACDEIERYDIWVHTHDTEDIEFFQLLEKQYPKIHLIYQPDGIVGGNRTINPFYRFCCEPNTIYIKLDDDIVWMEPDALKKMIDFRIDNPSYFVVSPLVINNSLSTYLLQITDKLSLDKYYISSSSHPVLWGSGDFAEQLHEWFIEKLKNGTYSNLHIGKHPVSLTRFSINSILWFGDDMKKLNGDVPGDDEEFLSCIYPAKIGKSNCFNGDVIIAHFAFFTQREKLDKANILQKYGDFLSKEWSNNKRLGDIYNQIQSFLNDISLRHDELAGRPSPYKRPVVKVSKKDRFLSILPQWMVKIIVRVHRCFVEKRYVIN